MIRTNSGTSRNLIAVLHDTLAAIASFTLALYIRLGDQFLVNPDYIRLGLPVFVAASMGIYLYMGLYRGSWRYASMHDLIAIVKTATLVILVFALCMFLITRLDNLPRSVLFINWMLLMAMLGGPRLLYRALREGSFIAPIPGRSSMRIPVLLIGAGNEAEQFIRNLIHTPHAMYETVAILDDDPSKKSRTIHYVPVYGGTDVLETVVRKLERKNKRPQKIIVTASNAGSDDLRALFDRADALGIPLARLPKLSELKHGISDKLDVRPVAVEDLLGRAQNVLDRDAMRQLIENRKVMVTGAGGTIGGELTRQIASYNPAELVIVEQSEFHLYQIEREIRGSFPDLTLIAALCNIRDRQHVDSLFARHLPEVVVHAAAIKHVPIAEYNIEETVLTNVFGSRNIAEACAEYGAKTMVMISTDKAVNPTNVMGATKRLAESYCQALGAHKGSATQYITVRFGNVLGSTGSVVPLFAEQLANGGPLTVTHPEMTRYFMTVREAVELVLQAAALGTSMPERKEYIFVLDMGKPMKIVDLAEQMIKLAGLTPGKDIEIVFTGLRPGEKLHEELFHDAENIENTAHAAISLANPRRTDIEALRKAFEALHLAARERRADAVLEQLKTLVPEFKHELN